MSLFDAPNQSIPTTTIRAPLEPVPGKPRSRVLPPDILIRIFQQLPVTSLLTVAQCSRRFKVLVYDDEIWEDKLRRMLKHDTGMLAAVLGTLVILSRREEEEEGYNNLVHIL